jgi:hypothetical protein
MSVTDEQLALLLQASRDFAFAQMARGERLIPFAAPVKRDGEIEFVRFVREDSELALDEIYARTQAVMAEQASRGELLAVSLTAAVMLDKPDQGFEMALRVHVEAPGFSRQVLVPYAVDPAGTGNEQGSLRLGELVPMDVEAAIFTI